ncbi:MAG: hypothetical protein SFU56_10075 [Capsulimonadales bacterium]|nr:hypothetical protein [Capsulimonadales bacterium]
MTNIPVGVKGRILNEGEAEPYVLVQDDVYNTGGYLVLTSDTWDFTSNNGHDYWVLKDELEDFFQEAMWQIDWLINHAML